MGDKSKGWIRLHRSVMDCFIYDGYAFDYYHAWCDILLNSNHKDKGIMFDGQLITIKRGQWLTSIRKLSNRWGWSKDKVSRYLNTLVENQMITKDCDKKRTLLTLVNYDFYQTDTDTDKDSDRTLTGHTPDTDKDTDRTKQECKNEKNDKNVKNTYSNKFEEAWAIYPRREDKAMAYKAYSARTKSGWSDEQLIEATRKYAEACKKNHTETRYIKKGSTFYGPSTPFEDYIPKEEVKQVDRFEQNFRAVSNGALQRVAENPFDDL